MKVPKSSTRLALGATVSVLLAMTASEPARAGDYNLTLNGSPVYERLDSTDDYLVEDNSYIDTYTFTGRSGQRVVITMSSQELDSYLILLDPNGNSVAQDDDSAGNLDARIDAVLPVNGTYTIYANSYSGGFAGAYTIQASTGQAPGGQPAGGAGQPLASNVVTIPAPNPNHPPAPNPASSSTATQSRYFCDRDGSTPLTMARSRRTSDVFPLIQWTSDCSGSFSPIERCQAVSARLEAVHNQFDRLILTVGTLNGQPVVCAASSRENAYEGLCAADGLVVTAQTRSEAEGLIRGLQNSFGQIVAGRSPEVLPAANPLDERAPSNQGAASDEEVPYIDLSDL